MSSDRSSENHVPTDIKPLVALLDALEMSSPTSAPGGVEGIPDPAVAAADTVTEKTETHLNEVEIKSQSEGVAKSKPNAAHTAKQLGRLQDLHIEQMDLYHYIHNLDQSIHLIGRSSVTTHKEKVRLLGYVTDYNGEREDQYTAHLQDLWENHKSRPTILMGEGNGDLSSFLEDHSEKQLLPNTVTEGSKEKERILRGEIPAPKFRVGQTVTLINLVDRRKEESKGEGKVESENERKSKQDNKGNGVNGEESKQGLNAKSKMKSASDRVVDKRYQ